MSCPRWGPLVAAHERDPGADSSAWREALAHADGCPACRRRAIALDPTLVFRGMAAPGADEVDLAAMQHAVAALVRARRIERAEGATRGLWWRRAAVVAATLGMLGLEAGPRPAAMPSQASALRAPDLLAAPVFDPLDGPDARVYQLPTEGYSVVMIVDANLDV